MLATTTSTYTDTSDTGEGEDWRADARAGVRAGLGRACGEFIGGAVA